MKNLLKFIPFIGLAFILKACIVEPADAELFESTETDAQFDTNCTGDLPKTRLINNGTISFDLQVINENGVAEITITSIDPGITTAWNEFAVGEVLFSVSNNTPMTNDDKVVINMETCMGYEIVINSDNEIESYDPIIF